MKKKVLVTGCAGFIGSNLVDRLLKEKYFVYGIDNFRTGKRSFLNDSFKNKNFLFIKENLLNKNKLIKIFNKNIDIIFHFAANADVRYGYLRPLNDLNYNIIVTSNVLEAMRINKIKKIVFCSTGSVYGETNEIPTPENASFPIQTSMYGASKLSCEGLIQAYSEAYNIKSYIFRFVSILGPRYTHGHIVDFYNKLKKNKKRLKVLGNGLQKKSYLHVYDCVDAILKVINCKTTKIVNTFNLGTEEFISVNQSIKIITKYLKLQPKLEYTGGKSGWIGDVPFILLDIKKIKKLGWKPSFSIKDSILSTLNYLTKK